MSEILSSTAFTDLRIDYADAARRATLYTTPEGYALKAHLGAQLDAAYAALRAENAALREALPSDEDECPCCLAHSREAFRAYVSRARAALAEEVRR